MPSREPLTRSGLTSRAGMPDVVMTFWDRRGLLVPLPRRTPTSNRFWPWYEANIAAVMMQLRHFGVPIEGLLQIATKYREAILWAERYHLSRDEVFALSAMERTLRLVDLYRRQGGEPNEEEIANMYGAHLDDALFERRDPLHKSFNALLESAYRERIAAIHASIPIDEFELQVSAYLTITEQPSGEHGLRKDPEFTYFWRTGDHWRFGRGEDAPYRARSDGAITLIAMDVAAALSDVWDRHEALAT